LKGYCTMGTRCSFVHLRNVDRPPIVRVFHRNDFCEFWDLTLNEFYQLCRPKPVLEREVINLIGTEGQAKRTICGRYIGDMGHGCRSEVCTFPRLSL